MKTRQLLLMIAVTAGGIIPHSVFAQKTLDHTVTPSKVENAVPQAAAGADAAHHAEWGYTGARGPEHWAELSRDYSVCANGNQESPIDLRDAMRANLAKLGIDWKAAPLRVANNGHTLQIDTPPGNTLQIGKKIYRLEQFHFHHPSEHVLRGRRFPIEIHFVHRGPDGVFGVVGIFVEEGKSNPGLQQILDAAPPQPGISRLKDGIMLELSAFLPRGAGYYRYEGSLTTPPCSETVDWFLLGEPIQASSEQIKILKKLYPMNARPIQPINRRFLLRSQ